MSTDLILSPDLVPLREALRKHFTRQKFTVHFNVTLSEGSLYRFTLVAKKGGQSIGIELRNDVQLQRYFTPIVSEFQRQRLPVTVYLAVPDSSNVTPGEIHAATDFGIGLLTVNGKTIKTLVSQVEYSRRFTLEPGKSLGTYTNTVHGLIEEYNRGKCLGALRDLAECVEKETMILALKAINKGRIVITAAEIEQHTLDWEGVINALSTANYRHTPQTKILPNDITNQLKSFKDARNLSDHWKNAAQKRSLDERFTVSMHQGILLLRTLSSIRTKLR